MRRGGSFFLSLFCAARPPAPPSINRAHFDDYDAFDRLAQAPAPFVPPAISFRQMKNKTRLGFFFVRTFPRSRRRNPDNQNKGWRNNFSFFFALGYFFFRGLAARSIEVLFREALVRVFLVENIENREWRRRSSGGKAERERKKREQRRRRRFFSHTNTLKLNKKKPFSLSTPPLPPNRLAPRSLPRSPPGQPLCWPRPRPLDCVN